MSKRIDAARADVLKAMQELLDEYQAAMDAPDFNVYLAESHERAKAIERQHEADWLRDEPCSPVKH